ncbi:MAG: Bax inhibitor-1/YccA family protein, partial [Bacteroidota bacterium]
TVVRGRSSTTIAVNSVIKNTYMLLAATLLFSAATAYLGMYQNTGNVSWLTFLGSFGLLFATQAFSNSVWGLPLIFGFTGLMGYSLGPMLNFYINTFSNGSQLVMGAMGSTGVIFLGLSGYALTTRKEFSFLGGFLFVGLLVVLCATLANIFFQWPAMQLAISSGMILLMSGYILYDTSRMIHGGQRNYILATIELYLNIFNLFVHILHILGSLAGRRD